MNSSTEKHPSLQRRIRYSTDEVYSRYLGISLPIANANKFCEGRFGRFLANKLGIKKLPYNVTLVDLVSSGCIKPNLLVELPCSYFNSWSNFPCCPRQDSGEKYEEIAGLYSYEAVLSSTNNIEDIIHPYDGDLKIEFVEKYRKDFPVKNITYQHPNGRKYKTEEVYFSYWQGLALASSIHKINNIELHLSQQEGVKRAKEIIKSTIKEFCERYSDSFERVSWYRTAIAVEQLSNINTTYGEIFSELSKYRENGREVLIHDLKEFLCLYKQWDNLLQKIGCPVIGKALEVLRKDIYLVFEQLCIVGVDRDGLFKEFSYGRHSCEWSQLHEVLYFEGYKFKFFFENNLNLYCEKIRRWGYECNSIVFGNFSKIQGFYPWIRSLYDLHETMKWDGEVDFLHSRIVDCLIVATVRTEIVVREMLRVRFKDLSGFNADDKLSRILSYIGDHVDEKDRRILKTVESKFNSTRLDSRPEDIFSEIDSIGCKNWPKRDLLFLKSILKFVCARNYFAHHAYKDDEFDSFVSELAAETLRSLVETLLFFHGICDKKNRLGSNGDQV